jgi:predicted nucleotidyltransferase
MALSQTEQRLIKLGQQMGKTPDEIKLGIYNLRTGTKPTPLSVEQPKEPGYFASVGTDWTTRADKVSNILARETPLPIKAVQVFGQGAGAAANTVESLPVVKQVFGAIGSGIDWLSKTKPIQYVGNKIGDASVSDVVSASYKLNPFLSFAPEIPAIKNKLTEMGDQSFLQEMTKLYDTDQDFKDTVDATANIARLGGDIQGIVDSAVFAKNVTSKIGDGLSTRAEAVSREIQTMAPEKKSVSQEILDIENNYVKTRKINIAKPDDAEAGALRIEESNVLPGSVDEAGKLDTMSPGKAYDQYKAQTLDQTDALGRKILQKEGATVNWKELASRMKKELESAPITSDAYAAGLAKIKATIRGLVSKGKIDVLGDIKLSDIHDEKTSTYGVIKDFTTPAETKAVVKAFGRAYKKVIEAKSKTNIKDVNIELGKYLGDLERIANLNGKLVRGGKLGKYAAQVGGNVAGAFIGNMFGGPIAGAAGTVVGGEVASLLKGKQMASTFGKDTGTRAPKSAILEEAKTAVAKPKVRDLNLPDKAVGAPSSIPRTKEIIKVEKDIRDNVRQQKKAIADKDFELVGKLKEIYDMLVTRLKNLIVEYKNLSPREKNRGSINFGARISKSDTPPQKQLSGRVPSTNDTSQFGFGKEKASVANLGADVKGDSLESLAKGKTLEEFVKGQGTPVFKSTDKDFEGYVNGVYKEFSQKKNSILRNAQEVDPNIVDVRLGGSYGKGKPRLESDIDLEFIYDGKPPENLYENFAGNIEMGGAFADAGIIPKPKDYLTRSQLTDIWKKANESAPESLGDKKIRRQDEEYWKEKGFEVLPDGKLKEIEK